METILVKTEAELIVAIRRSVLCCVSPVLEEILNSSLTACSTCDEVTLSGSTDETISIFLRMAHIVAHDVDDCIFVENISDENFDGVIHLAHKYEAFGIVAFLKHMLQMNPRVSAIVTLASTFPDDGKWLTSKILATVVDEFCSQHIPQQEIVRNLEMLPSTLLAKMLVHATCAGRNVVDKIHTFRPVVNDSVFRLGHHQSD